ncbi:MAG TPA: hypothetical protein VF796_26275 [Humisphaera sp.]
MRCGQLRALRWATWVLDGLTPLRRLDAELAFTGGVASGLAVAWGTGDDVAADGGTGAAASPGPASKSEGWAAPMAAAVARAGESDAGHRLLLDRAAVDVARELSAAWAGLGQFSRRGPGVPPGTLLAARGLASLAAKVTGLLRLYPAVRPDAARVAAYARLIGGVWDERFGDPDDATEEHHP